MSLKFGFGGRRAAIAALAFLLPAAGPALASPALVDFQTAGYQNSNSSQQRTLGWIFTALDDIAVTHLGVWDLGTDGLVASHQVGIWNSLGTLLGTTTVQAGTASAVFGAPAAGGSFRYEAVAPIVLSAGATYTIGALFDMNDVFEFNAAHVDTGSVIAFGEERYGDEGAGFVFPTDTFERWGLFGPNFRYAVLDTPAIAALFFVGLAGVAGGLRKRQRADAAV
jgi:hypothetical protein